MTREIATAVLTDLLFDEPGVGRCLVAPDGRVLRANPEWLRSTGMALDEVLGADIVELFPEARDMALALHARARAGHRVTVPRHAQRLDGRETWWEGSITPVPMEGGTGLLITARELSTPSRAQDEERHRARKAADVTLRETEMRLQRLYTSGMIGVVDFALDGRILDANDRFLSIAGYTREDLAAGRAAWDRMTPPEYRALDERAIAELKERGVETPYEKEFVRKDGSRVPILVGAATYDEQGHRGIGFVLDISERKRAEEALRESETRYRTLFDSIDEGFCIIQVLFDETGKAHDYRFVEVNPAFEQHTGLVNAGGKRIRELVPQQDEHWFRTYGRVAMTGEPVRFQSRGEALHRDYDVYAFRVGAPEKRKVAVLFNDVSEQKRAEKALRDNISELRAAQARLEEADRRKTEFLAVLSHELRNPLAPIRNSIHLLERLAPDSDQAARARNVVRRQTEHLTRLVDDLLDMTRISHGKIPLERSRVDLREIVRKTTDDLLSVFSNAGVDLRVEYATIGPMWLDADPTRMAQVVANLLGNSVKFTPRDGSVRVSIGAKDGLAELCVSDDGVGMDPATIDQMFEPFAQAAQTLARSKGGLGLGLALVKALVELHGGTVVARSDGPGHGAEFVVRLPLVATEAAAEKARERGPRGKPRTILIIEDNADGAQSLAELLELDGHRVRVARDGRSGIALACELHPDVVLCDIGLPDLDGYHVARTLRRDATLRCTRLVALSGYGQHDDRRRAREAGFDAHIAKPPDLGELMRVLYAEE